MDLRDLTESLEEYLRGRFSPSAEIVELREFGSSVTTGEKELKGFGYGKPYFIEFIAEGERRSVVLSSMKQDRFGHDHFSDRARVLLWQHGACNTLPRHVRSLDVGYFTSDGQLRSAREAEEYFILREKVEGVEYSHDLEQIGNKGITELDEKRAIALSSYLAEIHSVKKDDPSLYIRRIRDLIGHGECIMGLIDSYPRDLEFISWRELKKIEMKCVDWRWRLKEKTTRLCQVHGDFHPFNVLFRESTNFSLLDRSRGEWGEAADDLSSMTINYIFFSLIAYGGLEKGFRSLFDLFFQNYLRQTEDEGILEVVPPFYAFRGLVIASPIWYPHLEPDVRTKLFNFIRNVLELERFDPARVNEYLVA